MHQTFHFRCIYSTCPIIFTNEDLAQEHINAGIHYISSDLPTRGSTLSPLPTMPYGFTDQNPSPWPSIIGTPQPRPSIAARSARKPVPYKNCAVCCKRKKRCTLHPTKSTRASPGTACAGCKMDRKKCCSTPCDRCSKRDRPCYNDVTYRTYIKDQCNLLKSEDKPTVLKALQDLREFGELERKRNENNGTDRYIQCINEFVDLPRLCFLAYQCGWSKKTCDLADDLWKMLNDNITVVTAEALDKFVTLV